MRNFALLMIGAALLLQAQGPSPGTSLSGRRAPSFSLPDANNVQHDILDYRGKWLLLVYTTKRSPCTNCVPLAKALEPLQKTVSVLNVFITPPENAETAAQFTAENKITQPIVFDQSQTAIAYFKATPTHSRIDTPHVFIINPAGNIVQDWSDAQVASILSAKGGVPAALQAVMSSNK